MDIEIIVDKQSEFRMNDAAEKLKRCFKNNNIKTKSKDIVVIFSNDHKFVKNVVVKLPKNTMIINVTENLSEQHVINVIKYVSDICYLKTDVNIITTRIINAYNKSKTLLRQKV